MHYFKDQVIVITGAGSGIGRALAIEFANSGASLALNDLNEATLEETARLVSARKSNINVSTHPANIADLNQVRIFVKEVLNIHGQVNILINNAGVALGRLEIQEMNLRQWKWIMDINFGGNLLCTRGFLPHLQKKKNARIVNLSSIFGIAAVKERAGYCASKFAIVGLTESLRQELQGSNVQVSLVLPGGVQTNLTNNAQGWKNEADQKKAARMQKEGRGTSPEKAAKTILKGIKNKKYRILIGSDAKVLDIISRLLPSYYGPIMNYFISRAEKQNH